MTRWLKPIVFLVCLVPLARLAWKGYEGNLGANPIEVITHSTGDWTLIFLLVTLSVTPLRKVTGQLWLIRFRRMFGLFAFFYVTLHFLTYVWLDKFFDVHEMFDRCRQAKIHYGRFYRLCVADSFGYHFNVGLDSPDRRTQVEPAASVDISECGCGRDSLLLAGQGGCQEAVAVCGDIVAAAGISFGGVGYSEIQGKQVCQTPGLGSASLRGWHSFMRPWRAAAAGVPGCSSRSRFRGKWEVESASPSV